MRERSFFIPMTKCQRNVVPTFYTILSLDDGAISVRLYYDGSIKLARIGDLDVEVQSKREQLQGRPDISIFAGSTIYHQKEIRIMFWIQKRNMASQAWCSVLVDGKKYICRIIRPSIISISNFGAALGY